MACFKITWKLARVLGREKCLRRRRSEWWCYYCLRFVVVTCGWLVAETGAGPPFSSRLDGQASIAWIFLGPSINLDCELRKRLRCGAALGPWTPAQLEKLGPAVSSKVGSLVTAMRQFISLHINLRACRCSIGFTVTTEIFTCS